MNNRTAYSGKKNIKKKAAVVAVLLCIAAILLSGCKVKVNVNEQTTEELLADRSLKADQVEHTPDGSYRVTISYDQGGFEKMDLSQAYIAYYPRTVMDQVEDITGGDEDIPPLPENVQQQMNSAVGAGELQKTGVIIIETVDDNTLTVAFSDPDGTASGREYYFVIPNEGLTGLISAE